MKLQELVQEVELLESNQAVLSLMLLEEHGKLDEIRLDESLKDGVKKLISVTREMGKLAKKAGGFNNLKSLFSKLGVKEAIKSKNMSGVAKKAISMIEKSGMSDDKKAEAISKLKSKAKISESIDYSSMQDIKLDEAEKKSIGEVIKLVTGGAMSLGAFAAWIAAAVGGITAQVMKLLGAWGIVDGAGAELFIDGLALGFISVELLPFIGAFLAIAGYNILKSTETLKYKLSYS